MSRKDELFKLVNKSGTDNDIKTIRLVEEIAFIEEQLVSLKQLPFINVNPKNPMQQKVTPAAKQYKEFLQQYNNSLSLLLLYLQPNASNGYEVWVDYYVVES